MSSRVKVSEEDAALAQVVMREQRNLTSPRVAAAGAASVASNEAQEYLRGEIKAALREVGDWKSGDVLVAKIEHTEQGMMEFEKLMQVCDLIRAVEYVADEMYVRSC